MQTRKYPRTMKEGFGPYTDNTLLPMKETQPLDWQDVVVVLGSAAALIVVVGLLVWGQL